MLRSGEVRGVVIYLDRVFLVNALVDYLLLAVCAQLAAIPLQRWRCALGGFLGGLYAAALYLPGTAFLAPLYCKLLVGICMALISWGRHLKATALFLLSSFALAGALLMLPAVPPGKWPLLPLSAGLFYLLLRVLFRRTLPRQERLLPVTAEIAGRVFRFTALHDTGNRLCDPLQRPVLIVSRRALGAGVGERGADACTLLQSRFPGRELLWLSYTTVNGAGALPAVRCDRVSIGGRVWEGLYIALSAGDFPGEYQALWGGACERRPTGEDICVSFGAAETV